MPLRDEAAALALQGMAAAERALGVRLDYGRVDMMRLADGTLAVSELEVTEPGLYLDVLPRTPSRSPTWWREPRWADRSGPPESFALDHPEC